MEKIKFKSKTIKGAIETIDWFDKSCEASGANSQGEFLLKLLEKWNQDDPSPKVETKTVTIEKKLESNEILFKLSPEQLFAIRGNVLTPEFAQKQNNIIDSLKRNPPFLYFGNLYDPIFRKLWVRNIVLTKEMNETEKEAAIKHNMIAFLVNMFIMHAIDGNLSNSNISAESIKNFIEKENLKQKQLKNTGNGKE